MKYSLAAAAFAALALVAGAVAVDAQSSAPSPAPAASPAAFTAHAHVDVTVSMQTTYAGSAKLAVSQLGSLIRVDVLSLTTDAFPIPPITATALIDRRANTVTLWSDTTRMYRVQSFVPRMGSASPSPSRSPGPRATAPASAPPRRAMGSPLSNLELLDVTLHLTGHTTTAGLATTGLAFDLRVKRKSDAQTSHVTAATQLADEFAAFPVTVDLTLDPGAMPFGAKLAYAVDDFTRTAPAAAQFRVPAGYTEAPSIFAVIFPSRPRTSATAAPAPRITPPSRTLPTP